MKALFLIFTIASLTTNSYAFPELPFCPAGGPPGWMNHFNYKRDQNIWRHYSAYPYPSPAYNRPAYYWPSQGYGYSPNYNRPYGYSTLPYNYYQNYSQPANAPFRSN